MKDIANKLKNLGYFHSLPDEKLNSLASQFEIVRFKNRKFIITENEPIEHLYIILYGSIKIQNNFSSGDPVVLNFLRRGEILGIAMAEVENPRYPASAVALEDTALLKFSLSSYQKTLRHIPEFRAIITRQVSERFIELQRDRGMANANIPQRLADLILRLFMRQPMDSGSQISMPISRKDLACRLGTHTATIIRTLSRWTNLGIVKTIDKHIYIIDPKQLMGVRDERNYKIAPRSASGNLEAD